MFRGDLDNKPSPTLVVVFEGAVAELPKENEKAFDKASGKGKMYEALSCYELNDMMLRKILDLTWRENFNVKLVTWMGEEAAKAIQEIMDEENIPIRGVFASNPSRLARSLAYNPDIIAVYDPDPDNRFRYGSKGVYLTDPFQIGRIFGG